MPKLPGVNHLDAVRALEKIGFRVARQGKHIIMTDGMSPHGCLGQAGPRGVSVAEGRKW